MLFWTTFFCLITASLAATQAGPPDIRAEHDPETLRPLKYKLENQDGSDNVRLIRGLLMARQTGCPTGYGQCASQDGRLAALLLLQLLLFPLCFAFASPPRVPYPLLVTRVFVAFVCTRFQGP